MFRRSASLAIPHLKSFAAIPSVSLVQLEHTNRSVFLTHGAQREIGPRLGTFETNSLLPTRRSGGRKMGLCFAMFVFLTFRGPLASHDSNAYPNRSRIARHNATGRGFPRYWDTISHRETALIRVPCTAKLGRTQESCCKGTLRTPPTEQCLNATLLEAACFCDLKRGCSTSTLL